MMKALDAALLAVVVLPFAPVCIAQTPTPEPQAKVAKAKPPTGTVHGTVYCADTNLPARHAQIFLLQSAGENQAMPNVTATDLNGRFALKNVPEGRYYFAAMLAGYVDSVAQFSPSRLAAMSSDDKKEFEAHVTSVVISAAQPAEVSLRLERGAEIDGTVTYDDGGPAISLKIGLRPKTEKSDAGDSQEEAILALGWFFGQQSRTTDDHGHFRILGVPQGEYLVSVMVPTESADLAGPTGIERLMTETTPMGSLIVYAGGGLRASTAKTIKVTAGGAAADADIIIPLSKMHSIHGDVVLKSTGLPPPTVALQLVYADTQELARVAIASNGHFDLFFVPEDSYLLRAAASTDEMPNLDDDDEGGGVGLFVSGARFDESAAMKDAGATEIPLVVKGDVEGLTIAVPDPPVVKQPVALRTLEQGATPAPAPQ